MKIDRYCQGQRYYYYDTRTHSTQTDRNTDKRTERERIQINTPAIKPNLGYKYIK